MSARGLGGSFGKLPIACACLLALLLALTPLTAEAHANLVESDPAASSSLDSAPDRVTIRFTEPLEAALSGIQVLDRQGERVDGGDSAVHSDDPLTMSVSLEDVEDGVYTVVWRNVSTVDGHRVRGAFVFSVGEPLSDADRPEIADQPILQSWAEPFARWLTLLGGLVLVGCLSFRMLVSRPVVESLDARGVSKLKGTLWGADLKLVWLGLALFLSASAAHLVIQASVVFDTSIVGAVGGPIWSILTETDWGRAWIWRVALAVALGEVAFVAWRRGENLGILALGIALGAGALLTVSLTSHAAATPAVRGGALVNDFVHMIAAAVWVGGLFSLAVAIRLVFANLSGDGRRAALTALAARFSAVAGASVAALALTGAYSAWAQVTIPQALVVPYGSALVAKLCAVAVILALAAVNLIWVRPRLKGSGRAAAWLRRLVIAEAAMGTLVLLAVGFLTALEPARQVASRQGIGTEDMLIFQDTVEGAGITLEIEPGQIGMNRIGVSLRDRFGDPIANVSDVRVRLSYLDEDLGETAVSALPSGAGEFALDGQPISLSGAWQVEVVAQRSDAFDARAAFRFEVSGSERGSLAIAPSAQTGRMLLGVEAGVFGLLLLGVGIPLGGWQSRAGAATMSLGAVTVTAAAALVFNATGGDGGVSARNPIPPTSESIAAGMEIYEASCQACHGVSGRGDGPAGVSLDPPPADLALHVPLHPERALFGFVRDGIPDSAMVGVGDKLSEDEIWHLINYIQTFE